MIFITKCGDSGTNVTLIHAWGAEHNSCMEKNARLLAKALTWQSIGFVVMSLINFAVIGDWRQGLGLSVILTLVGLVSYYLHERVWSRIAWGRS